MNEQKTIFWQQATHLRTLALMLQPYLRGCHEMLSGHQLLLAVGTVGHDSVSFVNCTLTAAETNAQQMVNMEDLNSLVREKMDDKIGTSHKSLIVIPFHSFFGLNYFLIKTDENAQPIPLSEAEAQLLPVAEQLQIVLANWESIIQRLHEDLFTFGEDAMLVLDSDFMIIHANDAAGSLFNSPSNKLTGLKFDELTKNQQCKGTKLQELLKQSSLNVTEKQSFELSCIHDGSPASEMVLTISPLGAAQTLFRFRDVTLINRQMQQLLDEKIKAEDNDRLKMAFLANMSHEIRTPLNSIIGFSELLLEEEHDVIERIQYYNMIKSAGGTLLQLIEDIIDISKIEAGHIKISEAETEVNTLLDELFASFENERVKRHKSNFKLRLAKGLPDMNFTILTDPYRLRQILGNLLSNAMKFVDSGEITFGYKSTNPGTVQFFVRDTGIGIPREKTHLIFQRFGQIDPSHRNKEGTGLGLSITKHLVELMGGKIWFDSESGKGTTFYFTLPVQMEQRSYQGVYKPVMSIDADWSSLVFLIVDDVEANFMFYKAILKHTGALLLWARDGVEAVRICRNNDGIKLVLMDLQMPNLSGYEASKQIKAFAPQLPIIAQTAFADVEGRDKAIAAGCDDYITKPVNQQELVELIRQMLSKVSVK